MNWSRSKIGSCSCQCATPLCGENQETQRNGIMFADSRSEVGYFCELDQTRNGTEFILISLMEIGTKTVERMMLNFAESGHSMFRAISAVKRGISTAATKTLILRTIISVNQFSIFGAVAHCAKNYRKMQRLQGSLQ